jgi:hypothetical protein
VIFIYKRMNLKWMMKCGDLKLDRARAFDVAAAFIRFVMEKISLVIYLF